MKLQKLKIAVYTGLAVGASLICWKGCKRPSVPTAVNNVLSVPLALDSVARLATFTHGMAVVTAKSNETRYVPPQGYSVTEIKKDGTVNVTVKNKGLCLTPGIGLAFSDTPRLSLTIQFAYWNRLEMIAGLAASSTFNVVGIIGAGYRLDQIHLPNTSVMAGITTRKDPILGLVINF